MDSIRVCLVITQKSKLPFKQKVHVVGFVIVVRIVLGPHSAS